MNCRKCSRDIPEGSVFCNWCGAKQIAEKKRAAKTRGNGAGTAYKRGKTWTAQRRKWSDGSMVSVTKGGFSTKKEALAWCATATLTKKKAAEGITFNGLYQKFVERHAERVGKSTMDCYKAAYSHYGPLYQQVFSELTTEDWQECVDAVSGKRTKQNMKALGTLLYKLAIELQIVSTNYATFIWIGNTDEQRETVPFSPDQLAVILAAAFNGDRDAAIIAINCFTGFRPNELFSMKTEDWHDGCLHGGSKTEAGKNRIVPVPQKIHALVQRFADEKQQYLFRRTRITDASKWRDNGFYPCLERLGVQMPGDHTLTPYSCRHTYATMLKNVDGNALDKSRMMGHTSPTMTEHYQHTDVSSMVDIAERL